MKRFRGLIYLTLVASLAALVMYQFDGRSGLLDLITAVLDYSALFLLVFQPAAEMAGSRYRMQFLFRNAPVFIFTAVYTAVFITEKVLPGFGGSHNIVTVIMVSRSLFLGYRVIEGLRSIDVIFRHISTRPALSIMLSFMFLIMLGTLLLLLPFSTADRQGLPLIDAWFTATSAICVTGLIVVDTAVAFSLAGKVILLVLIQIGGLGIMILSYFSMFVLGRKMSIEEKRRLSFALSSDDMAGIVRTLRNIVYLTFSIELAGALLLFAGLGRKLGFSALTAFNALFHSVSAFCNAGFSLFSTSLEQYSGSPLVLFTVSLLIILGGLSFSVILGIGRFLPWKKQGFRADVNTRVVLSWTAFLIIAGMFFFYASEHRNVLAPMETGRQYLAAFFQSVTLRTAGFNSVSFGSLSDGTILIMCLFMFIGAASGGTAGGIKINTAAVLLSYIRSVISGSPKTTVFRHQLSERLVMQAFLIFLYGIAMIFLASAAIAFTHSIAMRDILFESVSAFGTVGLSTGTTGMLNWFGKIIIIFLMFNGRLGPLTILSTLSLKTRTSGVEYPQGNILIG